MNDSAYKYSICGLSIIGPTTKYIDIINTTYGMMIGTWKTMTEIYWLNEFLIKFLEKSIEKSIENQCKHRIL